MRRLVREESGIAMVLVLGLAVLLFALSVGIADVMQGEAGRSRASVVHEEAYQAAEAGIDDYLSKLIDDRLYYSHFVHPGEATRLATASGRTVTAGGVWQQTDGNAWTYPNGKDTWYGSARLGNRFEYDLEVVPPTASQPLIQITSTGRPVGDTDIRDWRALQVLVRPSSVSDYQMVADADIAYGSGATTYGKIYAGIDSSGRKHNITHDGIAYGDLYAEGTVSGTVQMMNGAQKYSSGTIRSVIKSPINFNSFLASLVDIHAAASAGGVVEDNPTVAAWNLTFLASGQVQVQACQKTSGNPIGDVAPTCGAVTTVNVPNNGAIYTGQPAIVSGVVNGRVTVGSASDIYVGGNISYQQSGDDVLGLVAANSIIVAQWVPSTLTWRAATIAQSGWWRSYGINPSTGATETGYIGNFKLSSMNFTGSTATYGGGQMSLFNSRVYNYDSTLLYLPPPWFPTLQDTYTIVLSREVAP
jgi:hypothetical protein